MAILNFPIEHFCGEIVRFLDALGYDDENVPFDKRVERLRYVYDKTRAYFDEDLPRAMLGQIDPVRLATVTRTISHFVVYCWSRVPPEAQVDISIYLSIINVLDDEVNADPHKQMTSFWTDLVQGKKPKHPFWILMNAHLPHLLRHYDSFCAFNIMRCTFDYFEGCWIEQHNFQGYPGSECYPLFMRRLNCLGGAVGGTIFPSSKFNEQELFEQLSCVIAQISGPVAFVNDLFSYYKEYNKHEANLVSNWCTVDGISMKQALERLTDETIRSCLQILHVLRDKDAEILATVKAFIHGYVTWHFCELRYRLYEVYDQASTADHGTSFRSYFEKAMAIGWIEPKHWTVSDAQFRKMLGRS